MKKISLALKDGNISLKKRTRHMKPKQRKVEKHKQALNKWANDRFVAECNRLNRIRLGLEKS